MHKLEQSMGTVDLPRKNLVVQKLELSNWKKDPSAARGVVELFGILHEKIDIAAKKKVAAEQAAASLRKFRHIAEVRPLLAEKEQYVQECALMEQNIIIEVQEAKQAIIDNIAPLAESLRMGIGRRQSVFDRKGLFAASIVAGLVPGSIWVSSTVGPEAATLLFLTGAIFYGLHLIIRAALFTFEFITLKNALKSLPFIKEMDAKPVAFSPPRPEVVL